MRPNAEYNVKFLAVVAKGTFVAAQRRSKWGKFCTHLRGSVMDALSRFKKILTADDFDVYFLMDRKLRHEH